MKGARTALTILVAVLGPVAATPAGSAPAPAHAVAGTFFTNGIGGTGSFSLSISEPTPVGELGNGVGLVTQSCLDTDPRAACGNFVVLFGCAHVAATPAGAHVLHASGAAFGPLPNLGAVPVYLTVEDSGPLSGADPSLDRVGLNSVSPGPNACFAPSKVFIRPSTVAFVP